MVVENEDACVLAPRAVEVRRREPTDSAAHDDQIVAFTGLRDLIPLRPKIAVAQAVGGLEAADVTAAQSGQCWRIVARVVLRRRRRGFTGRGKPGDQPA